MLARAARVGSGASSLATLTLSASTTATGRLIPRLRAAKRAEARVGVRNDRRSEGLIFGATAERPFTGSNCTRRAETAWKRANEIRTEKERPLLEPIGLHECRHTFASLMIDAGVNARALSTYMGHSSITITLDRYGHLFPGSEDEAAALLDKYLEERKSAKARLVQVDGNNP